MNSHPPVIAGIDFSAASSAVLRHAVHAAGLSRAAVLAVHVLDSGVIARRTASFGSGPAITDLTAQAKNRLDELVAAQTPGANVKVEILTGRPSEEIHRLIQDAGASTLVIAANDLTKKRLGSIASRCVRSAPCDVLVLRDWQEGNFSKIVVCTDFSPTSARALERAVALAREHGASLDIVHVMYPPSRDIWGEVMDHDEDAPTSYADECRARINRSMSEFLAAPADKLKEIEYRPVILEETMPSVALTHYAQDCGADLVVLGTHGMSRLAGMFIGTNAEQMLHDANVSVLAVRD